LKKNRKLKN